ncbi:MAG: thioredoxin [Planctomycetota bacterium]
MPESTAGPKPSVLDVTTATFEREVIHRSRSAPVLVDFWATWCGPCRTLSPILEKLAAEAQGAWTLAKVDIDRSPDLASAFGIQSVPTVVVVKDGQVVDGFLGAQPESKVRALLGKHVRPARDAVAEALELERAGKPAEAIAALRDRVKESRDDWKARGELARLLALAGALGEAERLLDALPETEREGTAAQAARAVLSAQEHAGDLAKLESAVAATPEDLDARLKLGRALIAARRPADALPVLFEAARRDLAFQGGEPRKALLEALAVLGEDDPLATEYRRKLSVLLCG